MKILLTILIVIVSIVIILLLIALVAKKEYTVERSITVNKSKQEVFNYVLLLKNQNNFSKWASMDPNMKQEFTGTDGTVGFISAWDSDDKNVGKGEQTITKINEGERIDFDLHFIKPFEAKALAYMTTEAVSENQTNVMWGFKGNMKYPMNLMLLFMNMEKMIGADLETGLTNLKTILEK
jgi:hypothetical protein